MTDKNAIDQALAAAGKPDLLQNTDALEAAEAQWGESAVLGIDTEFFRERTYRAELGLVQVSDGRRAWLIDPLALGDLQALKRMLCNSAILKVFHSASEDLEVLWQSLGVAPVPMIDTQIACAMLGQPLQLSYQHIVQWLCGVEVDKDQTRSNWLRRPLSQKQLYYAASDVVFLPMMLARLRAELRDENRWHWIEEDVGRMVRQSQHGTEPALAYQRINGAGRLDPVALRTLAALAGWREEIARSNNIARGFVLTDVDLMQLAQRRPQTAAQLAEIDSIHPSARKKYQQTLLGLIDSSLKSEQPVEHIAVLDREQQRRLQMMREVVKQRAEELHIDPALLASRKLLEALITSMDAGGDPPERLAGWRYAVITEKLLQLASEAARG